MLAEEFMKNYIDVCLNFLNKPKKKQYVLLLVIILYLFR